MGALALISACARPQDAPPSTEPRTTARITCPPNRGDCDDDPSNGCEVALLDDAAHCRWCDNACATRDVARALCVEGRCEILACNDGSCDHDGRYETGCEGTLCDECHASRDPLEPGGGGVCRLSCPPPPPYCF